MEPTVLNTTTTTKIGQNGRALVFVQDSKNTPSHILYCTVQYGGGQSEDTVLTGHRHARDHPS